MSASTVVAMRSAGSGSYSCGVYIGAGLANGIASQVGHAKIYLQHSWQLQQRRQL